MTTSQSAIPNPQSAITSAPSSRDLEIHRLNTVELLSTYRIAENFKISQTRVRQIVARVNDWLADMLPAPTDADVEKQKRLALHLAAAQLRRQIEKLETIWSATSDPKYLRQQTRAIVALARLGIPATTLDALAADIEQQSEPQPTTEPPQPNSEFCILNSEFPSSQNPQSAIPNPQSPPSPSLRAPSSALRAPTPPPNEDCSSTPAPNPQTAIPHPQSALPTSPSANHLDPAWYLHPDTLAGLELMENRLLNLLGDTLHSDTDRRQGLTETLTRIRGEKANLILKLNPNTPSAALT